MKRLLSDETIHRHREYLSTLSRSYAFYKDGIPELADNTPEVLSTRRYKNKDKILSLFGEIQLHRTYFDSFGSGADEKIPLPQRTVQDLKRALYNAIIEAPYGFVTLDLIKNTPIIEHTTTYHAYSAPLAIDVSEHAYFLDYGFDKSSYAEASIKHLRLSRLFEPKKE